MSHEEGPPRASSLAAYHTRRRVVVWPDEFAPARDDGHGPGLMHADAVRKPRPTGTSGGEALTRRKPRLSLRLPGGSLLRFADRQLTALLFQPPPRLTRFEPVSAVTLNGALSRPADYSSKFQPSEKNRRLASSVSACIV
ncbi:MAG: hypothetical protein ACREEM_42030 [Blastocatellia bacterium]